MCRDGQEGRQIKGMASWVLHRILPHHDPTPVVTLRDGSNSVGRGVENDIRCFSVQVSRDHCCITVSSGIVTVKDLNSFNGTYIGDMRIPPMRDLALEDGDLIGMGGRGLKNSPVGQYIFQLVKDTSPSLPGETVNQNAMMDNNILVSVDSNVAKENSKKRGPPKLDENPGPSKVPKSRCSDVGQNRSMIVNFFKKSEPKDIPMIDLVDSDPESRDGYQEDPKKKGSIDVPSVGDPSMEVEVVAKDQQAGGSSPFDQPEEDLPQDEAMVSFSQVTDDDVIIIEDKEEEEFASSSQLFMSSPRVIIKEEIDLDMNLSEDSDIEVIEDNEEVSFFEEFLSQESKVIDTVVKKEPEEETTFELEREDDEPTDEVFDPLQMTVAPQEISAQDEAEAVTSSGVSERKDSLKAKKEEIVEKVSPTVENLKSPCATEHKSKRRKSEEIKEKSKAMWPEVRHQRSVSLDLKPVVKLRRSTLEPLVSIMLEEEKKYKGEESKEEKKKKGDMKKEKRKEKEEMKDEEEKEETKGEEKEKETKGEEEKEETKGEEEKEEERRGKFFKSKKKDVVEIRHTEELQVHEEAKKIGKSLLCDALPIPQRKKRGRKPKEEDLFEKIKKGEKIVKDNSAPREKTPKETQRSLREERRERLKQLSMKKSTVVQVEEKTRPMAPPPCVKVTEKNRGNFLVDCLENLPVPPTSKKMPRIPKLSKAKPEPTQAVSVLSTPSPALAEVTSRIKKPRSQSKGPSKENTKPSLLEPLPLPPPPVQPQVTIGLKKRVQFKTGDSLVQVKLYECEGKLNKINKNKDFVIKHPKVVTPLQFVEGKPISFEETIYLICKWNTSWIKESKLVEGDPPVCGESLVTAVKDSYVSYMDYQRCLHSLMMHELWSSFLHDINEAEVNGTAQFFSGMVLDKSSKFLSCHSVAVPRIMDVINCYVEVSRQDLINNTYPKINDLVIIALSMKTADNKTAQLEAFGFIKDNPRIERGRRTRILPDHIKNPPDSSGGAGLTFSVMFRQRATPIYEGAALKIRVIRNILRDSRIFDSLARVPNSPLAVYLLNPKCYRYNVANEKVKSNLVTQFHLNDSQKEAVLHSAHLALNKAPGFTLIHGPPGTGKTQVIVSLIQQILYSAKVHKYKSSRPKILLCAPSNTAVDELVIRLMELRKNMPAGEKFKLVRHGRKKAMHPTVRDISSEALAEKEVLLSANKDGIQIELTNLRAQERAFQLSLDAASAKDHPKFREKYNVIKNQIDNYIKLQDYSQRCLQGCTFHEIKTNIESSKDMCGLFRKLVRETENKVLYCAEIIATTLSSSFTHQMNEAFIHNNEDKSCRFSCCIIDEATQTIEPDSLIPLLLNVNKFIMVGDPQQLPATVINKTAKGFGLDRSLFTRLYNCWKETTYGPLFTLNTQYRMHSEIVQWPASFFYEGKLLTDPQVDSLRDSPFVPYVVLSHQMDQDHQSEMNSGEADLVAHVVAALKENTPELSIGVITPYQKQRSFVTGKINKLLKGDLKGIIINTIDSYQGQERDVIIFSCVRTDGIGFLSHYQRLNVALTRAKSSLIVAANFSSLKENSAWKSLLSDAKSRGKVTHIKSIPSRRSVLKFLLKPTTSQKS